MLNQKIQKFVKQTLKNIAPEGTSLLATIIYNYIIKKSDFYTKCLKMIAKSSKIKQINGTILDVGSGPAYLPIYIVKSNPNCKIICVDASLSMVLIAKQNVNKAKLTEFIKLKKGKVYNLNFPNKFFDFVISTSSLHYWRNPVKAFNEIYRVLKDGHEAWIFDVYKPIPPQQFFPVYDKYRRLVVSIFNLYNSHDSFYDTQKINKIIQQSHFKQCYIENFKIFYKIVLQKA